MVRQFLLNSSSSHQWFFEKSLRKIFTIFMIEPIKLSNSDLTICSTFILKRDSVGLYWLMGLSSKKLAIGPWSQKHWYLGGVVMQNVSIISQMMNMQHVSPPYFLLWRKPDPAERKLQDCIAFVDRDSTWDWVASALYPKPCVPFLAPPIAN